MFFFRRAGWVAAGDDVSCGGLQYAAQGVAGDGGGSADGGDCVVDGVGAGQPADGIGEGEPAEYAARAAGS